MYRRRVPAKRWDIDRKDPIEQLVVLDAVHGDRIDQAVTGFWQGATGGEKLTIRDGQRQRDVRVHVAGCVGHNRLMNGVDLLPEQGASGSDAAILANVLACCRSSASARSCAARAHDPWS